MTKKIAKHREAQPDPPFPPQEYRGEKCAYREDYDPVTFEPRGPACGKVATQVFYWRDGRISTGCGQHGMKALTLATRRLVLCVHPIEPAFDV